MSEKDNIYVKNEIQDLKSAVENASQLSAAEEEIKTEKTASFQIGDAIRIIGQQSIGEILDLGKNKAVIALGDIRTTVALDQIEKVAAKEIKANLKLAPKGIDMNSKIQQFNSELNIIGTRGEEAVRQLNEYLDEAILLGVKQVRIVHGKGYGILRKLIREQLKANKMVAGFSDEQIELGGDGVTLVNLYF